MNTKELNRLGGYMYVPHPQKTITTAASILLALAEFHETVRNAPNHGITRSAAQEFLVPTHVTPIEITEVLSSSELLQIQALADDCHNLIQIGSIGSNRLCNISMECIRIYNIKRNAFTL